MARTSQRDLSQMVRHMESVTGLSLGLEHSYGAPRLVSGDGSREVSPRLPTGQLLEWMRAFMRGFDAARRPDSPTWAPFYRKGNPRPRRTARRKALMQRTGFFRKHAGGVVGESYKGGLDLARAELEMRKRGWDYVLIPEEERYEDVYGEPAPEGAEFVTVALLDTELDGRWTRRELNSHILQTLGFVDARDQDYVRVVVAELASGELSRA